MEGRRQAGAVEARRFPVRAGGGRRVTNASSLLGFRRDVLSKRRAGDGGFISGWELGFVGDGTASSWIGVI